MRRLLFIAIFIGSFFACMVSALAASADDVHSYCLVERKDAPGQYVCMCTDCDEVRIAVYSSDMSQTPPEEKQEGACTHFFHLIDTPKRNTVESVGELSHAGAVWYDCVCVWCDYGFEAFMTEGELFQHSYSVWEGAHLSGEDKHIYVSRCDGCGALNGQLLNCALWETGSCSDPHSKKILP